MNSPSAPPLSLHTVDFAKCWTPPQLVDLRDGPPLHGCRWSLDTDHRGLNKFQSSDDPNWHVFLGPLREAYHHILETGQSMSKLTILPRLN